MIWTSRQKSNVGMRKEPPKLSKNLLYTSVKVALRTVQIDTLACTGLNPATEMDMCQYRGKMYYLMWMFSSTRSLGFTPGGRGGGISSARSGWHTSKTLRPAAANLIA